MGLWGGLLLIIAACAPGPCRGVPDLPDLPDWGLFHSSSEAEAQDERNDGQILQDVLFSISEWKDRQQRKLLHQLFHSRKRRDEEVTCYGDLGCFRDEGPFNYLDMLPSPPEEIGTVFYLYTRRNKELPQVLAYNNITTVSQSHFNATSPTKVIIHGFGSSCTKIWAREMRLSFLLVDECNVVCVDWAAGAVDPNYVRAAVNTRLVGKQVALLIKAINLEFGDINNSTHLVGFSLGAHVSGFVGKELRNLSRITGLDPAGPLFEGYSPKVRLDKTDADYVDVIHSNGDSLIIGGLGAWEPIGHVDFYPNGGKAQRGCQNLLIGGLYDFIYSYSTKNESYRYLCNHRRAYKLFTDSISPKCKFTAFPCDSFEKFETGQCFACNSEVGECGELGYYSNLSPGRGSLYLLTREEEPFCANQFKINLMFTGSRLPLYSYGALQIKLINHDGINETFTLTSTHDELLTSGAKIEKLIVAHPALDRLVEVQMLYIAYEGWIYSGRYQWSIDKLTITDGFGKQLSFCKEQGELLPSDIPVSRQLQHGDCQPSTLKPPEFPQLLEKIPKKPPPLSPNLRPPLPGDISKLSHHNLDLDHTRLSNFVTDVPPIKHDLVIHPNHQQHPDFDPELDHTSVPKPLLLPIDPQGTLMSIPGKPPPAHHNTKYDYGINNSIKKVSHTPVWKTKYPGVPGAPLQPYHLAGPPGAWSIVTSRPGSLPPPIHVYQSKFPTSKPGLNHPNSGIELQFGPKFPPSLLPPRGPVMPPPNHFPARRRPGVAVPWPRHPLPVDMKFSGSETTPLAVTGQPGTTERPYQQPATKRNDVLREEEIIIIDNVASLRQEANTTQQPITNDDILSDNQLAIFKVGPDNEVERVVNMSSFDHNVTDTELTNYKYVILHKLPNGEALNLENLKTYNYEDLINDYKDQFSTDSQADKEFDRENPEYFDVPRRFSDNKNPYIIYQLNDPSSQPGRDSAQHRKRFRLPSKGVRPVYKPSTTEKVIHTPSAYIYNPTRKSPVFLPNPTVPSLERGESEDLALSSADMKLLQSKVDELLSRPAGHPAHLPPYPRVTKPGQRPARPSNDWVPTDTGHRELASSHPHVRLPENPGLDLQRLSKLSQLASVSIADAGSLAETVKSIRAQSAPGSRPGRLTIQLLPPRLSAVLTHLGGGPPPERQQAARAFPAATRQNKIAPAFKPPRGRGGARRNPARSKHGRSGEEYILTHPYQTQVIPKERRSRFIPLGPPPPKPVPWWHPGQPALVPRPREQHRPYNIMRDNLAAPSRPVRLASRQEAHLAAQHGHAYSRRKPEAVPSTSTSSSVHTNHLPTLDSLVTGRQGASIVRNLERINNLEKAASHLQKPFLPPGPRGARPPVSGDPVHPSTRTTLLLPATALKHTTNATGSVVASGRRRLAGGDTLVMQSSPQPSLSRPPSTPATHPPPPPPTAPPPPRPAAPPQLPPTPRPSPPPLVTASPPVLSANPVPTSSPFSKVPFSEKSLRFPVQAAQQKPSTSSTQLSIDS